MAKKLNRAAWAGGLVVGLVLTQVVALGLAHATQPPVGWQLVVPNDHVSSGSQAEVTVIGPPNTKFILSVTEPPWNASAAVFQVQGTTPNSTLGHATAINYSIPTAPFPAAEYQVDLAYLGGSVADTFFWIVPAVNTSVLNGTVAAIYGQLVVDQEILLNDRQQIAALSNQEQLQWWGMSLYTILVSFCLLYAIGRTSRHGALHDLYQFFQRHLHRVNPGIVVQPDVPLAPLMTPRAPDRVYNARYCVRCWSIRWTEAGIQEHLSRAHPALLGPGGPKLNVNYFLDEKAAKRVEDSLTEDRPKFTGRDRQVRRRSLGVNPEEVLGIDG